MSAPVARTFTLLTLSLAACGTPEAPKPPPVVAPAVTTTVTCADARSGTTPPLPTTLDATCAQLPPDILGSGDNQASADGYSWLAFVAVNWPVNPTTCAADASASILTAAADPTWLSYLGADEVFVPAGHTPANWCHAAADAPAGALFADAATARSARRAARVASLPTGVQSLAAANPDVGLFLHHASKGAALVSSHVLDGNPDMKGILDATGQPVVDQNGRFVRYDVGLGPTSYQYIIAKTLWTKAGLAAAGKVDFPVSTETTPGATEIKSAWKVLGPTDNPSHFVSMRAIVYNDDSGTPSPGPNPVTVGLVGLHVIQKTPRETKWLWSTFEQVENPTSFNNPTCSTTDCPPNVETATVPYTELDASGKPLNKPVQVVPESETTAAADNAHYQQLLAGTPFAYYKLVSTQWFGGFGVEVKPAKLGNSVLETFVAQTDPYSCEGCHAFSQTDFSFAVTPQQ